MVRGVSQNWEKDSHEIEGNGSSATSTSEFSTYRSLACESFALRRAQLALEARQRALADLLVRTGAAVRRNDALRALELRLESVKYDVRGARVKW